MAIEQEKCKLLDLTQYGKVDADYWVNENGEAVEMRDTYYENWEPRAYYCLNCSGEWELWEDAKKHLEEKK